MFEDKDQALRDDVRTLGKMVGDLIREQGGDELFEFVENARLRSIRRREENEKPGEELTSLVKNLDPKMALQVIRSFSTYFQMVNTAEKCTASGVGARTCRKSAIISPAVSKIR